MTSLGKYDIFGAMQKAAPNTDDASFLRERIPHSEWKTRLEQNEQRVSQLIDDYLDRRQQQEKDPVIDFLFEYYAFRPSEAVVARLWPAAARQ